MSSAEIDQNAEIVDQVYAVSDSCNFGTRYSKLLLKYEDKVAAAIAVNEVIIVNLMTFKGRWILLLFDFVSRFSIAKVLQSKIARAIVDANSETWLLVFGQRNLFLIKPTKDFTTCQFHELERSFRLNILENSEFRVENFCNKSWEIERYLE